MGARYYAAWLGRWTSADPLGVGADGPGIYNYTRGSPVVLTDPGGMEGDAPQQSKQEKKNFLDKLVDAQTPQSKAGRYRIIENRGDAPVERGQSLQQFSRGAKAQGLSLGPEAFTPSHSWSNLLWQSIQAPDEAVKKATQSAIVQGSRFEAVVGSAISSTFTGPIAEVGRLNDVTDNAFTVYESASSPLNDNNLEGLSAGVRLSAVATPVVAEGSALLRGIAAEADVSSAVDGAFAGLDDFSVGEVPQLGTRGAAQAIASPASIPELSGQTVVAKGPVRAIETNRLNHIFGKSQHVLDEFVAASGGREAAFKRIQEAANVALREGRLTVGHNGQLPRGNDGNIIDVEGTQIRLIGGRVVDGVVVISSASRMGLP